MSNTPAPENGRRWPGTLVQSPRHPLSNWSLALVLFALVLALLVPALPTEAHAAERGPMLSLHGGGRIGAFVHDGQNVYCLEPGKPAPLGTTTSRGKVSNERFSLTHQQMAQVNWAISTHGQSTDPVDTAAVQLFVWSIVAPEEYRGGAESGDKRYLDRLNNDSRLKVRGKLAELRRGAEHVGAHAAAPSFGALSFSTDLNNEAHGSVTLVATPASAFGEVILLGATFDATGTDRMKMAAGETATFTATPEAISSGPFTVSGTALLERPEQDWAAQLELLHTPGSQLLGGTGGKMPGTFTVQGNDAMPRHVTFAPTLTTRVVANTVNAGDALADEWTFSTGTGQEWIQNEAGNYVPVIVTATVYGPFATRPTESATPPVDAPIAARMSVSVGGGSQNPVNGTVTVSTETAPPPGLSTAPGFYTWVVSIDAAMQPDETRAFLPSGYLFTDTFGNPDEITEVVPSAPPTPPITTVPSESVPSTTPTGTPESTVSETPELTVTPAPSEVPPRELAETGGGGSGMPLTAGALIVIGLGLMVFAANQIRLRHTAGVRRRTS